MKTEKCFLEMTNREKVDWIIQKMVEEEDKNLREHWSKEVKGYLDRKWFPDAFRR